MDKENIVYTYNEISFSFKKERNPVTCSTGMNLENIMLGEINQTQILCTI